MGCLRCARYVQKTKHGIAYRYLASRLPYSTGPNRKNRKRRISGLSGEKTVVLLFQMVRIPDRITIISGIWPKPDDIEREAGAFQRAHLYCYHRNKGRRMEPMATEEQ